MPSVLFSNNASGALASSITTSSTTITLTTGAGAQFPGIASGNYFYATLTDSSNNLEIVKVTARASDVLTVVRAQEGTTARAYAAADKIELRVTAAVMNSLPQLAADQTFSGTNTFSGPTTFSGSTTIASPSLTGTPTTPTASPGTATTQVASTAFVTAATTALSASLGTMAAQNSNAVNITGGTLTGASYQGTTTTQSTGTNNTTLASTAFVQNATPYATDTVKGMVRAYVSGGILYIYTS